MKKSIFHYTNYRMYLGDLYRHMKSMRGSCSHRFIEQRVGISQGYFSRILNGTKNISDRVILKFIDFLKLSKNEGKFFENLVKYTQADKQEIQSMYYARMVALTSPLVAPLAKEQFAYFNGQHHVAVRALVELVSINDHTNFDVIGDLLVPPVTGTKIRESLQLLEKLNLVEKDSAGVYKVTDRIISSGNHPGNVVIRTYLQNSLKHAAEALAATPEKERMSSAMTVSVSPKTYEQIVELLAATRQEINKLVDSETAATRIYQLTLNLIPLSRPVEKGDYDAR